MVETAQTPTRSTISIQKLYQRLNVTEAKVFAFCEKWQVIELSVFGSALREDFRFEGVDPSDIDFLYISAPEARYGFRFFDMRDELARLLSREVDLISKRGIEKSRKFLRRKAILESARVIYAKKSAVNIKSGCTGNKG